MAGKWNGSMGRPNCENGRQFHFQAHHGNLANSRFLIAGNQFDDWANYGLIQLHYSAVSRAILCYFADFSRYIPK